MLDAVTSMDVVTKRSNLQFRYIGSMDCTLACDGQSFALRDKSLKLTSCAGSWWKIGRGSSEKSKISPCRMLRLLISSDFKCIVKTIFATNRPRVFVPILINMIGTFTFTKYFYLERILHFMYFIYVRILYHVHLVQSCTFKFSINAQNSVV